MLVLVLLATLAAVLSLRTHEAAGRAAALDARARQVQRRWAVRSVAAAVAPHTAALLQNRTRPGARPRPVPERRLSLRVGGLDLTVAVTDEQAKFNVHVAPPAEAAAVLTDLLGLETVERYVRLSPLDVTERPAGGPPPDAGGGSGRGDEPDPGDAESGGGFFGDGSADPFAEAFGPGPAGGGRGDRSPARAGGGRSDPVSRPVGEDPSGFGLSEGPAGDGGGAGFGPGGGAEGTAATPPLIRRPGAYAGFGQVFAGAGPWALLGPRPGTGLASRITLWGDGTLHTASADAQTLQAALTPYLGAEEVRRILRQRGSGGRVGSGPPGGGSGVGAAGGPVSDGVDAGPERLAEASKRHGLWVVPEGGTDAAFYLIEPPGRWRRIQQW